MTTILLSSMIKRSLEERWGEVLNVGSGLFNLVDATHPLRVFIGGNANLEPTLTLVLRNEPPALATFHLLSIDTRRRDDGTWLLLLQLQSKHAFREFATMCGELVEASRDFPDESSALAAFLKALDHWRNLFRPAPRDLLTESQLRGLAAELACMTQLLRPSRSWEDVIHAWVGPLEAPQDFRLSGNLLIEAKAVHRDSSTIQISSLDQLDRRASTLLLATVVVEREVRTTPEVRSLSGMVEAVEGQLVGSFALIDEFRAKLREAQFDPNDPGYGEYWFSIGPVALYRVDVGFPFLATGDVPSGIVRAQYEIGVGAIRDFAVEPRLPLQEK